jgi:opacity protein-like surface antigen
MAAADKRPRHEFQLSAGYSPASPTLIGTTRGARYTSVGISYSYRIRTFGSTSLYYNAGVMPAALLRVPAQTIYRSTPPAQRRVEAHTVYGFAVTPVGFMADFSPRCVRPFVDGVGGIIASTEPIPQNQANATGLNFLFGFGGGIRWNLTPRRVLTLGYRFLHISNAGTTSFNPGVDNNVVYIGYSFQR